MSQEIDKKVRSIKSKLKKQLGELSPTDSYWFDLLIDSYRKKFAAEENIERLGATVTSGERLFNNPATNHQEAAEKQIMTILKKFGLIPDSRATQSAENKPSLAELLGEDDA